MLYGGAFLSILFMLWALFDVIATDRSLCRNLNKELWILLIIFLPTMGALAWLLLGRPEKTRFYPGDTRYRTTTAKPNRPLGPDDDPRFFPGPGGAGREVPEESSGPNVAELRAWEDDLKRREEELRRKQEPGPEAG